MLNQCGDCWHKEYNEAFSKWVCKKWHQVIGNCRTAYKCRQCDLIGEDGDVRQMKAMFEMIIGDEA